MAEVEPRILVVQTAFLGDVILTTPLLAALRRRFPGGHLAFLATPVGCAALSGLAAVNEFIVYDKKGAEKGAAAFFRKARELRGKRFELAVSAHRSARTASLLALAGVPRRIGFSSSALSFLYHDRVVRDSSRHEVLRNLALMGPLGGAPEGFEPRLELGPLGPEVSKLIQDDGRRPRIGLCPGSVWNTKRWPAEGFARVALALRERYNAAVYLLGAEADRAAAGEVSAKTQGQVINLVGQTGLAEWMRLMAEMDVVITNDSAPTHIACAAGVPAVVIFGPTTPEQGFAPWGNRSRVLEVKDLSCRPCGPHGGRECPEGHFQCMKRLPAEEVIAAAESLLEGRDG